MVSIFAREITDNLTSLVKQIDKKVAKNQDQKMAAFVVVLSDDPDATEAKLKQLAEKHAINDVPLTVYDGTAGPPSYKIAQNADVTVMMWRKLEVKSNHAFSSGKLDKQAVRKVVSATSQILE